MSVASLLKRKYGVHKKIAYVHAGTLKQAKYKLEFLSKTSNTSYQHCKKIPIHRTGQGSKGEDIEIWTKNIDKVQENLGHWKKPEEIKVPEQFPVSLKTAITTSEAIFTVGVTQKEALMLYQGVYRPKIEYPLERTFLTNKQIKKIESASLPKIITTCRYNK